MKQRMQGMIIGVFVASLLFGGVTAFANVTRTIHVTYGVGIVVNGVRQHFAEDSLPFISGGRTFLPVRGVAEALGVDVTWNPATSTVYLDNPVIMDIGWIDPVPTPTPTPAPTPLPVETRRPLNEAAEFHHRGSNLRMDSNHFFASNTAWVSHGTVNMGGREYRNAVTYQISFTNHGRTTATVYTLHNLAGQFGMLTGYVGRIDGWGMNNATLNIFGDGDLLQTHNLDAQGLPISISVLVEGIRLLRIEFTSPWVNSQTVGYAFVGFLESDVPPTPEHVPASPIAREQVPIQVVAPFFDSVAIGEGTSVRAENTIIMGGNEYDNPIIFCSGNISTAPRGAFAMHNLEGVYHRLTGYVGRVDGSGFLEMTLHIVGDDESLAYLRLNPHAIPVPFDVDVTNVQLLEFHSFFEGAPPPGMSSAQYAVIAYLE